MPVAEHARAPSVEREVLGAAPAVGEIDVARSASRVRR
jgi:hypothetical protein